MTRELESELKQLFADLDEDLPAADFTSQVMSELRKPRRRERLLWCSAILAALAFLWFSFPHLEAGLRIVAGLRRTLFDVASESLAALSQSPLVYIYGTALGGHVLLWLMRRLRIRLM
jgi:hypothetical protein